MRDRPGGKIRIDAYWCARYNSITLTFAGRRCRFPASRLDIAPLDNQGVFFFGLFDGGRDCRYHRRRRRRRNFSRWQSPRRRYVSRSPAAAKRPQPNVWCIPRIASFRGLFQRISLLNGRRFFDHDSLIVLKKSIPAGTGAILMNLGINVIARGSNGWFGVVVRETHFQRNRDILGDTAMISNLAIETLGKFFLVTDDFSGRRSSCSHC